MIPFDDKIDMVYDGRDKESKAMPTSAVIIDNNETWLVCLVCMQKTKDNDEFMTHKCSLKNDKDLV